MEINKTNFLSAAANIGVSNSQAEQLWKYLSDQELKSHKFDLAHILYYMGAVIVILAMGWCMNLAWEKFGGGGILTIALAYAAFFVLIGNILWQQTSYRIPGGLFITLAVCMIPLAVYGFQRLTGWWMVGDPGRYRDFFAWIKGGWFLMEIGTILGGCVALWFYRFPFLTAPIFFSFWFMSMDLVPLLYSEKVIWENQMWFSMWFGLAILVMAYFIDQKTEEDYAFWGYFFGMLAFWLGMWVLIDSSSDFKKALYCFINIGLMVFSVLLQRRVFLVFGSLGVVIYISDLFYTYFSKSTLFPFFLSLIGVIIIFLGIFYRKYHEKIERKILDLVPNSAKKFLPKR